MKENEKFLKESIDLLNREFGQPLPTLSGVMKKHHELVESRANVLKAIAIAEKMSGDMTGAVKKIEKIQRGLSKQVEVKNALRAANESIDKTVVLETPAAIAAAASTAVLSSPKGGNVKVSTALKNKEHPLHKRALNWVKSKMKKKDDKPKKQSKADSDFYRRQYENKVNETQKYEIQTRFGRFRIEHDENPTAPGYAPEYFLEVNFENQYLGHFIIAGDPRDKGAKGKVSFHKGKPAVKLGHDK